MPTAGPQPISITDAMEGLTFLPNRTPTTTAEESKDAFAQLAPYRDGGIYVGHWAGTSEWERHGAGDEIVAVVAGATTMWFATDGGDVAAPLGPGDLVVVPQGTWHRFETREAVTLLSVTPQPTDHSAATPK